MKDRSKFKMIDSPYPTSCDARQGTTTRQRSLEKRAA